MQRHRARAEQREQGRAEQSRAARAEQSRAQQRAADGPELLGQRLARVAAAQHPSQEACERDELRVFQSLCASQL